MTTISTSFLASASTFTAAFTAALLLAISSPASAQAPTVKEIKATKKKPSASSHTRRNHVKSTAKNMPAGIEAADAALTPAELAIAEHVHVGNLPCELGSSVILTPDTKAPGYFTMQGKNFKYYMFPVVSTTGAVRLEDRKAGAVWLQLANKSMLMNQKLGIRLADECMSPEQITMAEALKLNPLPSVLDTPSSALLNSNTPMANPLPSVLDAPSSLKSK